MLVFPLLMEAKEIKENPPPFETDVSGVYEQSLSVQDLIAPAFQYVFVCTSLNVFACSTCELVNCNAIIQNVRYDLKDKYRYRETEKTVFKSNFELTLTRSFILRPDYTIHFIRDSTV